MSSVFEQHYGYIDGKLLVYNTGIKTSLEGDDQVVATIPLQFAGITPGPKTTRITFKGVVPPTGFDFDAFEAFLLSKEVEVRVRQGATGKSITSSGFIMKPSTDASVGKTVDYDYEFVGTPSTWS